jgi:hypothetical protein
VGTVTFIGGAAFEVDDAVEVLEEPLPKIEKNDGLLDVEPFSCFAAGTTVTDVASFATGVTVTDVAFFATGATLTAAGVTLFSFFDEVEALLPKKEENNEGVLCLDVSIFFSCGTLLTGGGTVDGLRVDVAVILLVSLLGFAMKLTLGFSTF